MVLPAGVLVSFRAKPSTQEAEAARVFMTYCPLPQASAPEPKRPEPAEIVALTTLVYLRDRSAVARCENPSMKRKVMSRLPPAFLLPRGKGSGPPRSS